MRIDYPRQDHLGLRRFVPSWRQCTAVLVVSGMQLALILGVLYAVLYAVIDIPSPNLAALAQATVFYYADGRTQLGSLGTTNRTSVPLASIPDSMQKAVLAAEDHTFYEHGGFSLPGIARAAWTDLRGGAQEGGSTITQQLVKNYYLTQDRTLGRKVTELFVSLKIERQLTKDEILADYLNTIYFGRGAYGVQAAAHAYFAEDVTQLTPAQSAVLASIIRSPAGYAPESHLTKLKGRWTTVLDDMARYGWLSPKDRAAAHFPSIISKQSAGHPADRRVTCWPTPSLRSSAATATARPTSSTWGCAS